MDTPPIIAKVLHFFSTALEKVLFDLSNLLTNGNLHEAEKTVESLLVQVSDYLMEEVLVEYSISSSEALITQAKSQGGRKFKASNAPFRLSTGTMISIPNYYVNQVPSNWKGSRHLLHKHLGLIDGATPLLVDKVAYCASICPSYDLANQTLMKLGVKICTTSIRDLTSSFSALCKELGEVKLLKSKGESLAGKRVIIGLDGGRTRTRVYNGKLNLKGNNKFDGEWRESKLFVIDVLDENGKPDPKIKPFYGARFSDDDILQLLKNFCEELDISSAEQVQIIADGAPWIWLRMKPLLIELGVSEDKIVETLDYYHASEHLSELVAALPKKISKAEKVKKLKAYKENLWSGKIELIERDFRTHFEKLSKENETAINYFTKNKNRMQYADYQANKLMCGSGIIESGIRRVINLRYKSNATFWDQDTVEKLFFFRGAVVSKRWDNIFNNLKRA
jgi:hypothetical protein